MRTCPQGGWVGRGGDHRSVTVLGSGGRPMAGDLVGRALAHGLDQGAVWRFVDLSAEAASSVAGVLGGVPHLGLGGDWEVVTASSALRVLVTAASADVLSFRLAASPGLGVVVLRCDPWGLVGVLGPSAGALIGRPPDPVPYALAVTPMDFTTTVGQLMRIAAPSLARCA